MKGEENQSGWDNGNKRKIENNSEKRNITDFGIVSYECRSVNCNEKRGRKENRRGSDLWFKMENQGRGDDNIPSI